MSLEDAFVFESKPNYSGYVLIGVGLPRTGTSSTRAALTKLLDGPCYHASQIFQADRNRITALPDLG